MKKTTCILTTICIASLILTGCQTAPEVAAKPAAKAPKPAAVEQDTLYNNISVSEAKGVSSPFKTAKGTIFPENKMGYKLILTSDISMPNLLATQLADRSTYQALGVFFPANRARDIKFTVSEQDGQNLSLIVTPTR